MPLAFASGLMLGRVAKFPNPSAPGVPGSGRDWALAAAAYIACWFTWIFVIFIVYELLYSFVRRWRVSECRASQLSYVYCADPLTHQNDR